MRYATTAAVNTVQRTSRHRKWFWTGAGVAATAGLAAWSGSSTQQQGPGSAAEQARETAPATTAYVLHECWFVHVVINYS